MQIRNDIRRTLAAKLDDAQLIVAGERIGDQFDEEIDKARRDEGRGRGGSDSGSGRAKLHTFKPTLRWSSSIR